MFAEVQWSGAERLVSEQKGWLYVPPRAKINVLIITVCRQMQVINDPKYKKAVGFPLNVMFQMRAREKALHKATSFDIKICEWN